uniref:Ig-like domain-containing protein n=1 Tax=Myripristis murdjan TaxID=586833 RepID=A0A667ZBE8_9TELE
LLLLLYILRLLLLIDGVAGQSVTLPCKYDLKTQGSSAVCWGRGAIPTYGCSDQIIATDGTKVREETRRSNRYQLLGKLDHGDVSLTILNATERDSGQYGCRVQVSGWFNDEKYHIELTITKGDIHC